MTAAIPIQRARPLTLDLPRLSLSDPGQPIDPSAADGSERGTSARRESTRSQAALRYERSSGAPSRPRMKHVTRRSPPAQPIGSWHEVEVVDVGPLLDRRPRVGLERRVADRVDQLAPLGVRGIRRRVAGASKTWKTSPPWDSVHGRRGTARSSRPSGRRCNHRRPGCRAPNGCCSRGHRRRARRCRGRPPRRAPPA